MINVVTGLAIVDLLLGRVDFFLTHSYGPQSYMNIVVERMVWNLFIIFIITMMISRVFILAHFPHQCALALVCGYLCYKGSYVFNFHEWSFVSRLKACNVLLGTAVLVYNKGEDMLGFNLDWSLDLANKYCHKVKTKLIICITFNLKLS